MMKSHYDQRDYSTQNITSGGDISTLGKNDKGILGELRSGYDMDNVFEEILVRGEHKFVYITSNNKTSFMLDGNGKLFVLHSKGGGPIESNISNIKQIATSDNITLALTNKGQLYKVLVTEDDIKIEVVDSEMRFKYIDVGDNFCMSINTNDELYSWGDSRFGSLGRPGNHNEILKIGLPEGVEPISISCGDGHSVLLTTKGVMVWGKNNKGQLGLGHVSNVNVPTMLNTVNIDSIYARGDYSVLCHEDGETLWVSGDNEKGQLTGVNSHYISFKKVILPTNDVTISGGRHHIVFIDRQHNVYFLGDNEEGQLGDRYHKEVRNFMKMRDIKDSFYSVSSGKYHTLAIKKDRSLWSWGLNMYGQLGDGTTVERHAPIKTLLGDDWRAVSAGQYHSGAINNKGQLFMWGWNNKGQLGNGTTEDVHIPTRLGTDTDWDTVECGQFHTVATKVDGRMYAWGNNDSGQLGDGTTEDRLIPTLTQTTRFIRRVSASETTNLFIDENSNAYTLGSNNNGLLGTGSNASHSDIMNKVTDSVASGDISTTHAVVINSLSQLLTWGNSSKGALSLGEDKTETNKPILVDSHGKGWANVSVGHDITSCIREDGTLWLSGTNINGYLGLPDRKNYFNLTQLGYEKSWKFISVSPSIDSPHILAIKENNTLWAWGNNREGQLGDGIKINRTEPIEIGKGIEWMMAYSGDCYSMAISQSGEVYAWGKNEQGRLGLGNNDDVYIPTKINSPELFHELNLGKYHVIGLTHKDEWLGWGDDGEEDDASGSPGPSVLVAGDMDAGYFGRVPASELFTGTELASLVGISQGTVQFNDVDWMKFAFKGKILFRPMKAFRHSISWDHINSAGCAYGTKTVSKNGQTYKVRLMQGALTDPAKSNATDRGAYGSEWNRLILPIHEQARDKSWAYKQYVEDDIPDWGIGFTDEDLHTHSTYGGGSYVWCQERHETETTLRVNRGHNGVSNSDWDTASFTNTFRGWAPVLEL